MVMALCSLKLYGAFESRRQSFEVFCIGHAPNHKDAIVDGFIDHYGLTRTAIELSRKEAAPIGVGDGLQALCGIGLELNDDIIDALRLLAGHRLVTCNIVGLNFRHSFEAHLFTAY